MKKKCVGLLCSYCDFDFCIFFLFFVFLTFFDKSVFGGRKLKVLCVCVCVYFMWKTLGRHYTVLVLLKRDTRVQLC